MIRLLVAAVLAGVLGGGSVPALADHSTQHTAEQIVGKLPVPDSGEAPADLGMFGFIHDWLNDFYEVISQPERCFTCQVVYSMIGVLFEIGSLAFSVLLEPVLLVLGVGFTLWIVYQAIRVMLPGSSEEGPRDWRPIVLGGSRYVVALVLLGAVTFAGNGARVYEQLLGGVMTPVLSTSVGVGVALMREVSRKIGPSGDASRLLFVQAETDAMVFLAEGLAGKPDPHPVHLPLYKGVMTLTAGVYLVGKVGFLRALGYIADTVAATNTLEKLLGFVIGVLLVFQFMMFLVTTGLRLLDPILRLTLVFAVSPLLIAAWVFPVFRQASVTGLRTVLFSVFYFVIAGVVFAIALQLIFEGLTLGAVHSYDELVANIRNSSDSLEPDGSVNLFKALVTFVVVMVAQALISRIGVIAGQLADYQADAGVATEVETQVRGLAMRGTMISFYTATTVGGAFLKKLIPGGR